MKYEIPLMRAGGGGSIVNTASMAGVLSSVHRVAGLLRR